MKNQLCSSLLVVAPVKSASSIVSEFNDIVNGLLKRKINVLKLQTRPDIKGSKYLCSKDWISFHKNGVVTVYPMSNIERQQERVDGIFSLVEEAGFQVNDVVDFTDAETEGFFLEGMGSIVLDRVNRVAYAAISDKCDEELFIEYCEDLEFTPIIFSASFSDDCVVEHTASILKISQDFILIASSLIEDKKERKLVTTQLKKTGRKVLFISEEQVKQFASELVQVTNSDGVKYILLSETSSQALSVAQKEELGSYGELVEFSCSNIERFGAHSLGAMLNEIV